jgi:hypothetical protein
LVSIRWVGLARKKPIVIVAFRLAGIRMAELAKYPLKFSDIGEISEPIETAVLFRPATLSPYERRLAMAAAMISLCQPRNSTP